MAAQVPPLPGAEPWPVREYGSDGFAKSSSTSSPGREVLDGFPLDAESHVPDQPGTTHEQMLGRKDASREHVSGEPEKGRTDEYPSHVPQAASKASSTQPAARGLPRVSAKPGGLAFPLGSGRGQFFLAGLVAVVVAVGAYWGVGWAIHVLVLICVGAALLRLFLPATSIPALVNRGRGFDVAVFTTCAVVLEGLLLSGIEL